MNAIERYDPSQVNKFTTFATPTIVGEIKRLFRDKGNFIRVPRRVYEIFTKASKIRNAHLAESGENMTTGELASALGVPVAQLENALEWGDNHFVRSLEPVSYTHLDVYKRKALRFIIFVMKKRGRIICYTKPNNPHF